MKINCPTTGTQATAGSKTERTRADRFAHSPSTSGNSYLDDRGYEAYRNTIAEKSKEREELGRTSYAEEIDQRVKEMLRNSSTGELNKNKLGDIAMSVLPTHTQVDVQAHVAGEMAHRVERESDAYTLVGDSIATVDAANLIGDDRVKHLSLPTQYPQKATLDTTSRKIVDNQGNLLEGLEHHLGDDRLGGLDASNATQASRLMSKQPFTTHMTVDDAKMHNELQIELNNASNAYHQVMIDLDLERAPNTGADKAKSKTESMDTVEKVFTEITPGNSFYFKVFHDWRARFYFKTRFFNPQGMPFEKASVALVGSSLKEFTPNTPEDAYFAVHMANMAGKDKGEYAQYNNRVKWFKENIYNTSKPVERDIWLDNIDTHYDADEVSQAVMHLDMATTGYAGDIPIAFDATTSGYQIIASIMGDQDGLGALTNIDGIPQKRDLYTTAAAKVSAKLELEELPRGIFKKPAMRFIYGSKEKGIISNVQNEYVLYRLEKEYETTPPPLGEIKEFLSQNNIVETGASIGKTFYEVLSTDPEFSTANKFKELITKAYNASDTSEVSWTFPDGQTITYHPVDKHAFKALKEKGDSSGLYGKQQSSTVDGHKYTYQPWTSKRSDKTDEAPVGLMANFVQSVDAYLANYVTANMLKNGMPVIAVHDSFATSPEYVSEMRRFYMMGLAELTSQNAAGNTFFQEALLQISNGKVNTFKPGPMDHNRLLDSQYALS